MIKQDKNLVVLSLIKDTEKTHDSAQYNTARNLTPRRMIMRGTSEKLEYLSKNETKKENILTHWSVAQAGSNDEKNWGLKVLLDCPLIKGPESREK